MSNPTTDAPLPSNLEAEQALLGCVLCDNRALEQAEAIQVDHFGEPVHGLLWFVIQEFAGTNKTAEPIGVWQRLNDEPALKALGGLTYLADLVDSAPSFTATKHFADLVKETATKRGIAKLARELDSMAMGGEEAPVVLEAAERGVAALSEDQDRGGQGFAPLSDALEGALRMAEDAYNRKGGLAGISTGLVDLDHRLGGLVGGNLLILAGRPSMGKSALALNIAWHVAKAGKQVAFFSLEMTKEEIGLRLLADVTGYSSSSIRTGKIEACDFGAIRDAKDHIEGSPLHIDDTGGLALQRLASRARRLKRTKGLDLLVVDYLQLITTGRRSNDNRVQEVSEITMGLKALAKELGVPIIALSQLSRALENRQDKRPQLSDLRESGSIEQDADVVMFVYRESYYVGRTEPDGGDQGAHLDWQEKMDRLSGLAEVIIGKARHGPIGTVRLSFNEDLTRFGNLAQEGRFDDR